MSFFLISGDRPDARLKGWGVSGKGGNTTVRIEVEYSDPYDLAYALKSLADIKAEQAAQEKSAAADAKKPAVAKQARAIGHSKFLALPPPEDR